MREASTCRRSGPAGSRNRLGGGCVAAVVLLVPRDSAIAPANAVAPTSAMNIHRRRAIARRRAGRVLWPCRVGVIAVMLRRCDRTQEPAAYVGARAWRPGNHTWNDAPPP